MGRERHLWSKHDRASPGDLHDPLQHHRHGPLHHRRPVRPGGGVRLLGGEDHHPGRLRPRHHLHPPLLAETDGSGDVLLLAAEPPHHHRHHHPPLPLPLRLAEEDLDWLQIFPVLYVDGPPGRLGRQFTI